MLVGIVFSIPLLVFTVYTVLTVYVDENGFTNPSSVFVKVENNEDLNNPLTAEDVVKEAQTVIKQKPDIILKVPEYFNKFNMDPQKFNMKLVKDLILGRRKREATTASSTSVVADSTQNSTNATTSSGESPTTPGVNSTTSGLNATTSEPSSSSSTDSTSPKKNSTKNDKSTTTPGIDSTEDELDTVDPSEDTFPEPASTDAEPSPGILGRISQAMTYLAELPVRKFKAVVGFFKFIWSKITGTDKEEEAPVDELAEFSRFQHVINVIDTSNKTRVPLVQGTQSIKTQIAINRNVAKNRSVLNIPKLLGKVAQNISGSLSVGNKPQQNSPHYEAAPLVAAPEPKEEEEESFILSLLWPSTYYIKLMGLFYSCPLPTNDTNTFYSVEECPTCTEGSQDAVLYTSCASPYVPPEPQRIVCFLGDWVTGKSQKPVTKFPRCKKSRRYNKCPQLTIRDKTDRGVSVECAQNGHPVDCESHNITWYPGTELGIVCPLNYRPKFGSKLTTGKLVPSRNTFCDDEGKWTKNNVSCEPVCGVLGKLSSATPLVMNGRKASPGYLPWVVALFLRDGSGMEYICSGSIITDRALITAGHCVYTREPSEIRVLPGNTKLMKNESLLYKVSDIRIPFSYSDKQGNYGSDIAVLMVETPFQFSDLVRPVCVDWENKYTVRNQKGVGKIAGWGLNEKFKEVSDLNYVDLPLVSVAECSKASPIGFKKFFGYTTFCAGYKNGTGVCNGDSGSGFMLEREGLWYIAGTVSISPRQLDSIYCEPKSYSIYTKVELFIPWIKAIVTNSSIV